MSARMETHASPATLFNAGTSLYATIQAGSGAAPWWVPLVCVVLTVAGHALVTLIQTRSRDAAVRIAIDSAPQIEAAVRRALAEKSATAK